MNVTAWVRIGIRPLASALLAIAFGSTPEAAPTDRGRAAFIRAYCRAVVERLRSIHRLGPRSTSRDRFLAVSVARADQSYVQCIFFDDDTKMH